MDEDETLVSIAATRTSTNPHAGSRAGTFLILLKRRKITAFVNTPARLIVQIRSVKVSGVDWKGHKILNGATNATPATLHANAS